MLQSMQGFFFGASFDDSPSDVISESYHVRFKQQTNHFWGAKIEPAVISQL
jgi:hypothetical protein